VVVCGAFLNPLSLIITSSILLFFLEIARGNPAFLWKKQEKNLKNNVFALDFLKEGRGASNRRGRS
jgi:hypothetical protein